VDGQDRWRLRLPHGPASPEAPTQLSSGPTDAGYTGFGTLEVWNIKAGGKGWSHPVHVHFEEGIILSRGGKAPPEWEKWARKDVYRIGSALMVWTRRNGDQLPRVRRDLHGALSQHSA
jgi:hypothetical protein